MFMLSYSSTVQHINCFPAFTQSRKPNGSHLMWAQTKYQSDFCHSGTSLLSCFIMGDNNGKLKTSLMLKI